MLLVTIAGALFAAVASPAAARVLAIVLLILAPILVVIGEWIIETGVCRLARDGRKAESLNRR